MHETTDANEINSNDICITVTATTYVRCHVTISNKTNSALQMLRTDKTSKMTVSTFDSQACYA